MQKVGRILVPVHFYWQEAKLLNSKNMYMNLSLNKTLALAIFFLCTVTFCAGQKPKTRAKGTKPEGNQKITSCDYAKLKEVKNQLKKGNGKFNQAYKSLISQAEKSLNEGPFSVTTKTQIPTSGDKHDYLSLAPYWWPDSAKPDGLPWIRKDGEVNPLTRGENVDEPVKDSFFETVYKLSLAFYFSDDERYATKATELLTTWFVKPETKMNPHLNFAQGVPGVNTGRCFGIIEFTGIKNVITAMELLKVKEKLNDELETTIRNWLTDYLQWLQTSKLGIEEKATTNNHGTWYDVQVVCLFVYLNREPEAKIVLEQAKTTRIFAQIAPDGSQPEELTRTKSLSYSIFNLNGLTELAYYGALLNVDLWNFKKQDGSGIQKAYEFLYPYAAKTKEWNYQQISDVPKEIERLKSLFGLAGSNFNSESHCKIFKTLEKKTGLDILLQSCK
jgi:Alginate lyase